MLIPPHAMHTLKIADADSAGEMRDSRGKAQIRSITTNGVYEKPMCSCGCRTDDFSISG